METPILRYPGGPTHLIWFSVANWSDVEKVLNGMEAQLQKLAAEESKRTESAHAAKQTLSGWLPQTWQPLTESDQHLPQTEHAVQKRNERPSWSSLPA